ncbi:AHH domain-containing protein [Parasphingorhabdus sp.]|uniref:AHH domain-containing protein n=1 Tax=Parasphingorhabdus sp. TaxID=2709688 RepID=UPI002F94CF6C
MMRFSKVNRKNDAGYNPCYQRHHLIPLQAATIAEVREALEWMSSGGFDFDNFKTNGVLLPSDEHMALRTGHPLHRGPHPRYNELVIERLLLIIRLSEQVDNEIQRKSFFRLRIGLLQSTLRRALVGSPLPVFRLNKRDPGLSSSDFARLDNCVDALYTATQWPPIKGQDSFKRA